MEVGNFVPGQGTMTCNVELCNYCCFLSLSVVGLPPPRVGDSS